MKNDYLCEYGNCEISLPSEEMFYVKMPKKMFDGKVKRFCSKEHMIKSAQDQGMDSI